mgnify:FL=1|jgi:hypothetical protein
MGFWNKAKGRGHVMFGFFKRKDSPQPDRPYGMSKAEYDIRRWHLVCTECGNKKSYWALGAIRTSAAGGGKSRRIYCTQCQTKRRFITKWIDIEPIDQSET